MPRDSAGSDRTRGSSRSRDDNRGGKGEREKVSDRKWNNLRLYFFENGNGRDVKPIVFKEVQWRKGLDFIVDYVSREYGQRVKGLYTLDGDRVKDKEDLVHKGAYVLVFNNRPRFDSRNTYYLPENAVDTSFNDDEEEGDGDKDDRRDDSRDREKENKSPRRRSKSRSKSRSESRSKSRERSRDRRRSRSKSSSPRRERSSSRSSRRRDSRRR